MRDLHAEIERLRAVCHKAHADYEDCRNDTIEECAQIVDNWRRGYGLKYLAEAIRALKGKP